jgi:hypothetical protein
MVKKLSVVALMLGLMSFTPSITKAAAPPPGRCPRIHEAVRALETAMHEMESAKWDYCGDKVEAMESTRRALEHLRKAEQCKDCAARDHDDHDRR